MKDVFKKIGLSFGCFCGLNILLAFFILFIWGTVVFFNEILGIDIELTAILALFEIGILVFSLCFGFDDEKEKKPKKTK